MNQTVLFTVIPRGITLEGEKLPVSVFVSPRLFGATKLGAFPDWLDWTAGIKDSGLRITFLCKGNTLTLDVDREPLKPKLWNALFNEETLVRSHEFDDYSDRAVFSYSVRMAMSALKAMYQVAGIALGLPNRRVAHDQGHLRYRSLLTSLLQGLEVNWDEQRGEEWRNRLRDPAYQPTDFRTQFTALRFPASSLGKDGLLTLEAMPQPGSSAAESFHRALVTPFAVFHHMPQPKSSKLLVEEPPNFDDALDFHQALTALNNYPKLQRALGLVFDFDLPRKFVARTTARQPKAISVSDAQPGGGWRVPTKTPPHAQPISTPNWMPGTGYFLQRPVAFRK